MTKPIRLITLINASLAFTTTCMKHNMCAMYCFKPELCKKSSYLSVDPSNAEATFVQKHKAFTDMYICTACYFKHEKPKEFNTNR